MRTRYNKKFQSLLKFNSELDYNIDMNTPIDFNSLNELDDNIWAVFNSMFTSEEYDALYYTTSLYEDYYRMTFKFECPNNKKFQKKVLKFFKTADKKFGKDNSVTFKGNDTEFTINITKYFNL